MLRLPFSSGQMLLAPDTLENAGGCHFLAVEDNAGTVVAHSTFEQWQTAPVPEMTRLIDALAGARAANDICIETGERVHTLQTGNALLVVSADGNPVDSLQVDTLEREMIAFWVCDEWREDPELVAGALIGALRSL